MLLQEHPQCKNCLNCVKYKYKAFRVGPMRLKIVRQPHITHEQNSQDNLDLNKQPIKSNSLHKLKNSSNDKCTKETIEAIKKRPILEWIPVVMSGQPMIKE